MKCEFKLIYGGRLDYFVKDKKTGEKTSEKASMVQLLELDEEKNFVNVNTYSCDVNTDTSKLIALKPCIATIDISATSNYKKLVNVRPI